MTLEDLIDKADNESKGVTLQSFKYVANPKPQDYIGTLKIGDKEYKVYCAEVKANLCGNELVHSFRFIEL